MAYVNIKEKSDLVNIRKKLQKRFLNEKLGEQDIYQENIKRLQPLIEPIKDITTHQKGSRFTFHVSCFTFHVLRFTF